MSIKKQTPCDFIGPDGHYHCPYAEDGEYVNCEWYCGAEEPEDRPEVWEDDHEGDYFGDGDFSYFMATEDDYYGGD